MGMASGGARGALKSDYSKNYSNNYSNDYSNNYSNDYSDIYSRRHFSVSVPSSTTITYEGILNAAYYRINKREEKKTINMEISLASVINPISKENEVWLGTFLKSKYDGQKIDKLIDLSIAIDISGSMSGSRINMAKKSLIQLIEKLNDEDNIAISKFNHESTPIFKYQKVSELKKTNYKEKIEELHATGGTDVLKAFYGAYNLMSVVNCNKNKIRRMIIITDMEDRADNDLTTFCERISKEGIYLTILGISSSFRTDLADMTSNIKGANYVVITELKDINKYLVEDFEYLCFQNASDVVFEVTTPYIKIDRIIGSGREAIKETYDKSGWNLEQHKFYNDDFKQKIFFLLLYFKRKNWTLPKPVIFTLSEFMVPGVKKEITKMLSCFPSQIKTVSNRIYVEGGMILLKLDKNTIRKENLLKFELKYQNELEDKKESIDMEYSFKKEEIEKPNYFSDPKIELALSLFYFAKFNRRFMKICNEENKKKKYNKKYIQRPGFKDEKEEVKKFVEKYLSDEKRDNLNEEIIKGYLNNMEKNATNAIKFYEGI